MASPCEQIGRSVLIVEDNLHLRRILAGALEHRGYTISEATTGDEAIVTAIKENPKLILLDLTLPDMTGTEAARALKQNPQTAHSNYWLQRTLRVEWRSKRCALEWLATVQPVPLKEIEAVIEQFILLER